MDGVKLSKAQWSELEQEAFKTLSPAYKLVATNAQIQAACRKMARNAVAQIRRGN